MTAIKVAVKPACQSNYQQMEQLDGMGHCANRFSLVQYEMSLKGGWYF